MGTHGKLLPCYNTFLSLCTAVPEFAGSDTDRAKARKGVVLRGQKRGKRKEAHHAPARLCLSTLRHSYCLKYVLQFFAKKNFGEVFSNSTLM